ncbi:MAG: type V CRISPR-associated endonuclease Cas1 [bacterium]
MLSFNDFNEKRILFIQSGECDCSKIKFRNDNIVFEKSGEIVNQASCHKVFAIFIIGDASLTTVFIRNAKKFGISIFLLKYNFLNYASINAAAEGNYLLRAEQYKEKNELAMAKNLMKNKFINQLALIKSVSAENSGLLNGEELFGKIEKAKNEQELLGLEGSFTKKFFKIYFADLDWYKRMPGVKIDHYNILLDIGYTFLFNFVDSMLKLYGFDTYKGFYHKLFFKRQSLSCDIVEPFRCLIDKQLLKSFHLKQINEKDFKIDNGRYLLKYENSKKYAEIFFGAIMENKEEIFIYVYNFYRHIQGKGDFPFFNVKI